MTTPTNQHYELPVEVFEAFLDRRLKYSSGLYVRDDMSLDDAQTAKLHFVASQLGVSAGDRVLDVGCGWGSLVLFLAQEYGCVVTGVTPSQPQAEYIERAARELDVHVDVRLGTFDESDVDGWFDAVALLGSIVHMPDRTGVLTKAHELLHRRGRLYLSESCFRNAATYEEFAPRPGTRHVTETVFGFADMVPLSVLVESVETAGFSLTGLTDLTAHYLRTISDWAQRAEAGRDAIDRAVPGLYDDVARYLQTAEAGWGYTTKHYAVTARKSRL